MTILASARHWARFASVRLAVAAGAVAGWAATEPQGFAQLVSLLPAWARPLVGLAVTVTAIGARVKPQPHLTGAGDV